MPIAMPTSDEGRLRSQRAVDDETDDEPGDDGGSQQATEADEVAAAKSLRCRRFGSSPVIT